MLFNVSMYPHKDTLNVCNKFYYISFDSSSVKSSQLHSSFVEVPIIIYNFLHSISWTACVFSCYLPSLT